MKKRGPASNRRPFFFAGYGREAMLAAVAITTSGTMRADSNRRGHGLALSFSTLAAAAWAVGHAQEKAVPASEVVVTGTRIARAGYETLEPASVIGADYVAARGLTNVADALNESPGFGVATTPEGGQSTYGPGVSFVNRFGLGSHRTLTLINGRRFVTSNAPTLFGPAAPGNQVDLNLIPTVLLDRVENLAVGGAPAYGADAIAGVVNVKLREDFSGVSAYGQYGQLENGGMQSNSLGLVGGWNFAGERGNVTAAFQRSRIDGLRALERDRFASAYVFAPNPTTAVVATQPGRTPGNDGRVNPDVPFNSGLGDDVPGAVLIRNRRNPTVNFGGVALPTGATNLSDGRLRCFGASNTTCLQFAPDGRLVPYDPGTNFGNTDAVGGDGLQLPATLQLMSDLERDSAVVTTHFDVTEHFRLFADFVGYEAHALEIVDQTAYNATSFGGASGAITLPADHPALTQQARDTLAAQGVTAFRLSRAHRDLAESNARSDTHLWQGAVGARGEFEAGSRVFQWETYFNFGRSDAAFYSTQVNRQRFVNALNVVNAGGQLRCDPNPGYAGLPPANGGRVLVGTDAPVADPGCVPLDIFGEGRPSAAAVAYLTSVQRATATLEQEVFNANLGSALFDIRGGSIEYNIGFERRHERGRFQPDAYLEAGLGRSSAVSPTAGSYTTNEVFGELVIPLVSTGNAMPALRELTVVGKGRRVDNSVNGQFTAWTAGLQWSPLEDLQLRGSMTRSLRAPSITELFTPASPLFTQVQDPCSTQLIGASGARADVRRANCERFFAEYGLPAAGWQSRAVSVSTQGSLTGDPGLRNETSDAWTAGFVVRPRALEGFEMAVDWIDVRIEDVITTLFADDFASACFENFEYPNPYCDYLTRTPPGSADPGQITFARMGYANGAFQSMAGLTAEASYRRSFEKLGAFDLGLGWFRLREELRSATGVTTTNSAEQIGSPTDSVQLNLGWRRGPFGARWQTNYVSPQLYNRNFNEDSRDILRLGSSVTHNLSLQYAVVDAAIVRLAITNVLDEDPPFPVGNDSFNGNYDFLGRRYSASFTWDFGR